MPETGPKRGRGDRNFRRGLESAEDQVFGPRTALNNRRSVGLAARWRRRDAANEFESTLVVRQRGRSARPGSIPVQSWALGPGVRNGRTASAW